MPRCDNDPQCVLLCVKIQWLLQQPMYSTAAISVKNDQALRSGVANRSSERGCFSQSTASFCVGVLFGSPSVAWAWLHALAYMCDCLENASAPVNHLSRLLSFLVNYTAHVACCPNV